MRRIICTCRGSTCRRLGFKFTNTRRADARHEPQPRLAGVRVPSVRDRIRQRRRPLIAVESLDHNPPKYIEVFPPGATEPSKKINEGGLVDVVEGIAFPKTSRLFYVASANDNDWMKLTYPRGLPRDVVDVIGPAGLALSP